MHAMTFILAAANPRAAFLVADRRLSNRTGVTSDRARKLLMLEAMDGGALIGYAGVGRTSGYMEPSKWMANVFRGRDASVENYLRGLGQVTLQQLPKHAQGVGGVHVAVAACTVNGKPVIYSLDLSPHPSGGWQVNLIHYWGGQPDMYDGPVFVAAGSGRFCFERLDLEPLKRLMRAHTQGKVEDFEVMKYLADVNHRVHQCTKSVGPKCIVGVQRAEGGGSTEIFDGCIRELPRDTHDHVPAISRGMPVTDLIEATIPFGMGPLTEAQREALSKAVAAIPDYPDERLR